MEIVRKKVISKDREIDEIIEKVKEIIEVIGWWKGEDWRVRY